MHMYQEMCNTLRVSSYTKGSSNYNVIRITLLNDELSSYNSYISCSVVAIGGG